MTPKHKPPKPKKDGTARKSTRGPRKPKTDQTNWRAKLMTSRVKFDDDAKEVYLRVLRQTGRRGMAAEAAGVCSQTVANHAENDPDFATALDEAFIAYGDTGIQKILTRTLDGYEKPIIRFDKDGDPVVVGHEHVFDSRLQALFLQRHDPAYKERSEVDLKGGGGVLVVPGDVSPEEWVRREMEKNKSRQPPEGAFAEDDGG